MIDIQNFSIGDALLVALIGILIVFAILLVIIGYLWVQSKVFKALDNKKTKAKAPAAEAAAPETSTEVASADDEIAAVISACIYAMLEEDENVASDAEFVIRKIEKLNWSK